MAYNKKAQSLSLNTIIVAALALIVLVVIVAIFTGRLGLFQKGLGGESKQELSAMRAFYGQCQPNAAAETTFLTEYSAAEKIEDQAESSTKKGEAKSKLQQQIDVCRSNADKSSCESSSLCKWS